MWWEYFTFPMRPDMIIWEAWYIHNECETQEHELTSLSSLSEFTSRLTFASNIFSVSENSSAESDGTYGTSSLSSFILQ